MTELVTAPTVVVRCPADGRVVGEVPNRSRDDVAEAVRVLRLAQPEWEALGTKGRARWLRRLRDWLLDNADHIAGVLQSETGKPRAEAAIEAPLTCDIVNYYARHAARFLADRRVRPHGPLGLAKRLTTVLRPYPVVGVISPWNFPLVLPAMDVSA